MEVYIAKHDEAKKVQVVRSAYHYVRSSPTASVGKDVLRKPVVQEKTTGVSETV